MVIPRSSKGRLRLIGLMASEQQASEQAAQVLARESKALHGRISTMETEMAVKVCKGMTWGRLCLER